MLGKGKDGAEGRGEGGRGGMKEAEGEGGGGESRLCVWWLGRRSVWCVCLSV